MVWHIALSSPRRCSDLTELAGWRRSPFVYLSPPTLDILVSSPDLSPRRVQWNYDIPKREIWTFSQSDTSPANLPMPLDSVTIIDQCEWTSVWKHRGSFRSTWIFFLAARIKWCTRAILYVRYPHILVPLTYNRNRITRHVKWWKVRLGCRFVFKCMNLNVYKQILPTLNNTHTLSEKLPK